MKKIEKSEFAGSGAAIQALGVIVAVFGFALGPIVGVVGLMAGICLLVVGSNKSKSYRCPKCGNRVDKESRICPHCSEDFTSDSPSPSSGSGQIPGIN